MKAWNKQYLPTPPHIIDRMLEQMYKSEESCDQVGGWMVLEPSAGDGRIADKIMELWPTSIVDCIEQDPNAIKVLNEKEHFVISNDLLEFFPANKAESCELILYDRVVMNPPFAMWADIKHTRKAFSLLKPGGRLIGIMSEQAFLSSEKEPREFCEWFLEHAGIDRMLEARTFMYRRIPILTRMVIIDKEE